MTIVIALLLFGIIILIHEFGHFLFAKLNGISVTEFSLGMGPRLWSFQKGETRYSLKLLPLGGSCAMVGEDTAEEEIPGSFNAASVWGRISVVAAGPIFNFILAFVLAVIIVGFVGYDPAEVLEGDKNSAAAEAGLQNGDIITEYDGYHVDLAKDLYVYMYLNDLKEGDTVTLKVRRDGRTETISYTPDVSVRYLLGFNRSDASSMTVESLIDGMPLQEAGLQPGDTITAINGVEIADGEAYDAYLAEHPLSSESVEITYDRDGLDYTATITPKEYRTPQLGFSYNLGYTKTSGLRILKYGALEIKYMIRTTLLSLKELVTGQLGFQNLSGPVGVVDAIGTTYEESKSEGTLMLWMNMLNMAVLLSANLGVMKEDEVNIIVHGHDPSLSEMICEYADDPEMIAYAKEMGAKGINVAGVCCTSNEVAMRRGVPMAGNFLQQENVVLTGACEAIVVDVQCIFPALGPLSKCFHTKFITTSPIAQMPDAEFIRFNAETAGENAKAIVKMAIDNFKNRKPELVHIPQLKQKATVGYSVEAIVKVLDGVTNSQVDETGTTKPLLECITSGVIRGAVAMVGCNNPKIRPDYAHIELMKKCIANDIVVIASGCSAQAAAKAGLMDKSAKDLCGAGLKRVCELADIPPVLHMGSCVDISRMMILAAELAKDAGLQINQLPVVGCAPEWMSEKAVSIGNYVVGTGIDTFLGVDPYVSGSSEMGELLTEGTRKWTGAAYTVETDIEKLVDLMIERIEEKRTALGI